MKRAAGGWFARIKDVPILVPADQVLHPPPSMDPDIRKCLFCRKSSETWSLDVGRGVVQVKDACGHVLTEVGITRERQGVMSKAFPTGSPEVDAWVERIRARKM
jgi:hypothetical protein